MIKKQLSIWVGFAGLTGMLSAQTVTLTPLQNNFYSTGVDNLNIPVPVTGQTDLHYTISASFLAPTASGAYIANPAGLTPIALAPAAPYVVNPHAGNYIPLSSHWLDPGAVTALNLFRPSANYSSRAVFNYELPLTNIPAGQQVTLTAKVASDDQVIIAVAGNSPTFSNHYSAGVAQPQNYLFAASATLTFVSGTSNEIIFQVANTGSFTTGLDVDFLTGSYTALSTSTGIVIGPPPSGLDPNQTAILNQINFNNAVGGTNACFARLTGALIGTGDLGGALDQLSPERLDILKSIAFNNASFMTQNLDDYLAHRRSDTGVFSPASPGIDTSGLTVRDASVVLGLSPIYSRLLAWNPAPMRYGLVSDSPAFIGPVTPLSSTLPALNFFFRGNVTLGQNYSGLDTDHTDYTTSSFQAGGDYRITDHLLLGFFFSYDHSDTALDNRGSSATVDSYSPSLYASYANHGWYANGLASYSRNGYTEQRQIAIGSFQEVANGSPSGDQETVNADGGYDFHHQGWTYGPTVGFQYVHWSMDSFSESGGCSTDLAVNEQSADSFRSRIGAHVSYAVTDAGVTYTPFLTASWQHEFLDDSRGIDAAFAEVNPITFTVNTNNPSRDSCLLGTGLNVDLNQQFTLFFGYDVQVGQNAYFGQQAQAGLKVAF